MEAFAVKADEKVSSGEPVEWVGGGPRVGSRIDKPAAGDSGCEQPVGLMATAEMR